MPADILHVVRREEINAVASWFHSGARVLELGGADGFQASLLAQLGCYVESIDVSPVANSRYHEVARYDGVHIPFGDAQFDIVFSSNVLEHVSHLDELLREVSRVLVAGGLAVHVLPSASWRLWTLVAHYPALARRIVRQLGFYAGAASNESAAISRHRSQLVKRALGLMPHGEYSNALAELYYFSAARWTRVLVQDAFELISHGSNGLFYTGQTLLPALPLVLRRSLSRWLGASCHVFILRRKHG